MSKDVEPITPFIRGTLDLQKESTRKFTTRTAMA